MRLDRPLHSVSSPTLTTEGVGEYLCLCSPSLAGFAVERTRLE